MEFIVEIREYRECRTIVKPWESRKQQRGESKWISGFGGIREPLGERQAGTSRSNGRHNMMHFFLFEQHYAQFWEEEIRNCYVPLKSSWPSMVLLLSSWYIDLQFLLFFLWKINLLTCGPHNLLWCGSGQIYPWGSSWVMVWVASVFLRPMVRIFFGSSKTKNRPITGLGSRST